MSSNTNTLSTLEPIEASISLTATPAQVFRALTSQNELRKWWAPRVIMSKNIVSQENDKVIEMRLMQAEKYHLVRYSWWGQEWDPAHGSTVITFQIRDLGASRSRTGEGLRLELSHDGWVDASEREKQKRIWDKALPALEALLKGKEVRPWWEAEGQTNTFRPVKISAIKTLIERLEQSGKGTAQERRKLGQAIWKVCTALDAVGNWFGNDNAEAFELRASGQKVVGLNSEIEFVVYWQDLRKLLGTSLDDFANRYSVEQDIDVYTERESEPFRARALRLELFAQWSLDVISEAESMA